MRKALCVLAMFGLMAASGVARADAAATATGVCAGCHGPKGVSAAETFPNLAGQKKAYLASALKAYRDKTRTGGNASIMNGMAASLNDQQIDELAAYYSNLKPE